MSLIEQNLNIVKEPGETKEEFLRESEDPRYGLEVETHVINKSLQGGTVETYHAIHNGVTGRAKMSLEAASTMFEVKNGVPKTPDQPSSEALNELTANLKVIEQQIRDLDHQIIPHSILPWSDFRDLAGTHIHPGPNPRPTSFINFFMANDPARARNFITVAGMQSSLTHRTPEDSLRYYNRMAHLSPLLASVMSSVPPYAVLDDHSFGPVKNNLSLARRLQTGGGIDNAFPCLSSVTEINAKQAELFMTNWNEYVWDTPIFSYYDPDDSDEFKRLKHFEPSGTMVSFRNLPEHLKTRENFNMASSIQYGLLTMSHIPPIDGQPDKRRVEARFFDTGTTGQIASVAGLTKAVAFDENFGSNVDEFLRSAGFSPEHPDVSYPLLMKTLDNAAHTDFDSLAELSFGNLSMAEAAKDFHRTVIEPLLDRPPELQALAMQCTKSTSPALEFRQAVSSPKEFKKRTLQRAPLYNSQPNNPELVIF